MSGGRIAALILAILLLVPGGFFILVGVAFGRADYRMHVSALHTVEDTAELWGIAAVILGLAGLLFWFAFPRR